VELEQIFRAHERDVYGYLLRVTGDARLAEDLAQDTLLRAWEGIHRFRGESSFRTWLIAIARSRLADHFRKQRPEVLQEPPDVLVEHPEAFGVTVEQILQLLPLPYREAIVLCDVYGFEPSDAASVVGITDNAFRVRLHRARKAFREMYADDR
jgi:RNA polymerase sigma-70 factor, ECF subfamily